ncbi:hypothetical protein [Aliarcobacter cryaerophilus]|uniref:hypothetical protein n=1 Tax=Aliarcobacter cryaerophilus TaxID=28198 RepID=UPI0021B4B6EA|nr:hypothetical protein [Aliarcobacter cryaerophilus]MCT7510952.1 hypothetical protein [Aliarcobacter cryaerophilus]
MKYLERKSELLQRIINLIETKLDEILKFQNYQSFNDFLQKTINTSFVFEIYYELDVYFLKEGNTINKESLVNLKSKLIKINQKTKEELQKELEIERLFA